MFRKLASICSRIQQVEEAAVWRSCSVMKLFTLGFPWLILVESWLCGDLHRQLLAGPGCLADLG